MIISDETFFNSSASLASYRFFFAACSRDISFKTSYIAPVTLGMYLQQKGNPFQVIVGEYKLFPSQLID